MKDGVASAAPFFVFAACEERATFYIMRYQAVCYANTAPDLCQ